ncbi:MAG TPA: metal-dependent hydrolase [Bryobacteraceae bacterium]|nr:metal-dependent hydrolase [Bryobacteraceae bacterium]
MLVGHLAVALGAKRAEPRLSLGTLTLSAQLPDLIAFPLLIAGVERFEAVPGATINRSIGNIPYSHSLLADAVWGAIFAGVYFLWRRHARGAWILFGAVLSHWVLDVISHRPDMLLAPGGHTLFGLQLWNSMPATLLVEGGLWLAAIIVYVRSTKASGQAGTLAFWAGVALMTLAWYGNITSGMDTNPVRAGVSGLVFFSLIVAWAGWMDHARALNEASRRRAPRQA